MKMKRMKSDKLVVVGNWTGRAAVTVDSAEISIGAALVLQWRRHRNNLKAIQPMTFKCSQL